ncbi:MAG: PH domain-containing protein [Gemmatimonadota bacterium]|nr:PH domain-containing protein [Gemmatimonadota bacterium]MDE3173160.1 PH domain-containing protein [Gemmatimonadota bacterium]MDE3215142.1 PH domain-containing protein [Gemmatimonadota bacterium]
MASSSLHPNVPLERYRSAVDAWVVALILIGLGVPTMIVLHPQVTGLGLHAARTMVFGATGFVVVFLGWLFATTDYTLDTDALIIRSGPLRWTVPYAQIRSVRPTANMASAPAMSLRRLEVRYGDGQSVVISPRDRDAFVAALRRRAARLTVLS